MGTLKEPIFFFCSQKELTYELGKIKEIMSIKLKDTIYDLINNSDKLDGKDSSAFSLTSHTHSEYLTELPQHTHNYASTVKIGSTSYNSSNNVISLPAYPTLSSLGASASSHNHDSIYLKLAGGTMTNVINFQTATQTSLINAKYDGTNYTNILWHKHGDSSGTGSTVIFGSPHWENVILETKANQNCAYRQTSGTKYKIWDSGNDGSDSGLDADTLDGNHATQFFGKGWWNEYNHNKSISTLEAVNSSTNAWNSEANVTLKLVSSNNAIVLSAGGTSNERVGLIQVGHASTGYAQHTGSLYLNKLGGKVYIGTTEAATINSNVASATKLQTARTIWGQSFNGEGNIDGTLHLKATGNSYTQGIRIYQNSTSYAGILLGSSLLTASTGSDNNSWFICTDSHSNFSISKGGYLPTDNTCFGWDANENKWRINGASIIDINTESSESSSISLNSSTSCLKLFAWNDGSTYIESGNKDFTANMPLRITGINGGNGSDLYLNFDNVRANGVVRASSGYVALGSHGTLLSLGAYSRTRVITTGWTASECDFTTIYIPGSSNSNDAYLKIRQYDLIYNGNTVIHSGNISNYVTASSSGTSYLGVQDTRNDNTNSHSGRLSWHLKYNSSVGLSAANGSTYSGVLQLSPWGDSSGGVNYQVAFCGNGNDILYRSNTGTWHRILDSNNYSSYCMSANNPTGSGTLRMDGSNSRGSFPAVKWHIPNVNWAQILMNGSGELEFRGGAGQDTSYITTRVGAMVCTSLYVGGEQITFTT